MRFDSALLFKWMDAKNPAIRNTSFYVANHCILSSKDPQGQATGLTVFEPKDLVTNFIPRFKSRLNRPESSQQTYSLYMPGFLKHRAEALLKGPEFQKLKINYTPVVHVSQSGERFFVRDQLRVVNVDDSPVLLKFLKHTLDELGFFNVVAQVSDPKKAVETIQKFRPDLVTMDIQMPGKTGVEVVRDLMAVEHFPVLMISSVSLDEGTMVFDALNSGAFDYIQKPKLEDKKDFVDDLCVKALAAVEGRGAHSALHQRPKIKPSHTAVNFSYPDNLIWCLGASTGGTQALTSVFTSLPTKIPPTFVVQHIPPVYSKAFADSLNQLCPFTVKEAEHGETVQSNHVYIAPGGKQMSVESNLGRLQIVVNEDPPVNRFKPSVDYMFKKVAQLKGLQIVAGVLTGMGRDGAQGLLDLKKIGAQTFVQDEKTSTVYGMPRAAKEIGAADKEVPLEQIAQTILSSSSKQKKAG